MTTGYIKLNIELTRREYNTLISWSLGNKLDHHQIQALNRLKQKVLKLDDTVQQKETFNGWVGNMLEVNK